MCGVNECKFDICEEKCVDLPFAYRCECEPPKMTDPKNPTRCIMGNQCMTSNCSQFCIEKGNDNYECTCATGYLLESDGHGCKLKSKLVLPMFLSVTSDGIRMGSLRGSYQMLSINSTTGRVLAYSAKLSSIYWIDGNETVGRTFTNGTNMLLQDVSVFCPDSLAVDELSGNIYWTTKSRNAIMMSDSDSRYIKTLYRRGPSVLPYALAIDSTHRLIFWSDIGKKASVNRMSIIEDDGGVDIILDTSLIKPTALAVDPFAKRIYWIDEALDYIGFCNYDGTNRHVLARKIGRGLQAIDVFADYVYFSDYSKGTVERMHKIHGSSMRTVVFSGLSHPRGIQIIHPEKRPKKEAYNPCQDDSTCTQLCVPSDNTKIYQCLCRDGMRYDDGKCVNISQISVLSDDSVMDYVSIRNFVLSIIITCAVVMFFFHKNRSYILSSITMENNLWQVEGQERFPLSRVTRDGGVENPVFEPNEDTPMDPTSTNTELSD
ncbi:Low-density lipoprotein receptor repeat class B [Dictyocaulus viviparus]|uniref:Low-density lipoprotein receptor repeat class B n=1 Tax=Dictyocaulus viviparus TaxID=29172 RepID=A0A0D8Y074_DICVI|nr:Low-density lipoprotein receptor repeat class B [Dictyocaulus viviparus]